MRVNKAAADAFALFGRSEVALTGLGIPARLDVTFRSSLVMKVTSISLGLNLGTILSVPRIYAI